MPDGWANVSTGSSLVLWYSSLFAARCIRRPQASEAACWRGAGAVRQIRSRNDPGGTRWFPIVLSEQAPDADDDGVSTAAGAATEVAQRENLIEGGTE